MSDSVSFSGGFNRPSSTGMRRNRDLRLQRCRRRKRDIFNI
jgi:hypothetical protein